jgi:hypothetical protein
VTQELLLHQIEKLRAAIRAQSIAVERCDLSLCLLVQELRRSNMRRSPLYVPPAEE